MVSVDNIIYQLDRLKGYFLNAYNIVSDWVWPFYYLASPLWSIYYAFHYLSIFFAQFNTTLDIIVDSLKTLVSWPTVWNNILSYVPNLLYISQWFYRWVTEVAYQISRWWNSTQQTVQGWITIAKQYLQTQIDSLVVALTNLQASVNELLAQIPSINEILAWFSNWWARILSPLTSWWNERLQDVNSLIDSALREWFPFYNDLVELWSDIKLFFTDPLQWLYNELDEWFERFW